MTAPRIGVTLGDPAGIGPEIIVKILSNPDSLVPARYVIYGDSRLVEQTERLSGLRLRPHPGVELRDLPQPGILPASRNPSKTGGCASFAWFEAAVRDARRGALDAVVTGPVSKESWSRAGLSWRGHTDYLEHNYPGAIMSFWSQSLRIALLSHHLPLREALDRIQKNRILTFLLALGRSLKSLSSGISSFLVSGMNPHAGENGILGNEEETEIRPAVEEARNKGMDVDGPFPPDTVFLKARSLPDTMAVALFHDQGLIAFKMETFSTGVNATLGLPFIRTSPDHGTAFEIAGKNRADPSSMREALALAAKFAGKRR